MDHFATRGAGGGPGVSQRPCSEGAAARLLSLHAGILLPIVRRVTGGGREPDDPAGKRL